MKFGSKTQLNLNDSPLSQFQYTNPALLMEQLKCIARGLDPAERHCLRQRILSGQTMMKTNSVSVELQARHFHLDYVFEDEYEAFFLTSCRHYHPWHVKYIAEQIVDFGEINCLQCKATASAASEIKPDALLMSILPEAKHFPGSKVIFKKRQISSAQAKDLLNTAEFTDKYTLIISQDQQMETEIWQIVKDERLSASSIEIFASKVQDHKGHSSLQYQQALQCTSIPIIYNLLCFRSQVRIRNPLLHKHCRPQTHYNRLALYSFQHVYETLFVSETSKEDRVRCIFPSCPNYFDRTNFKEVGLVLPNLHTKVYLEDNQNIFGQCFAGGYILSWYLRLGEERITSKMGNGAKAREVVGEWIQRLGDLVATTSLRQGQARTAKLQKRLAKKGEQALDKQDEANQVVEVVVKGDASLCPVRCYKCHNLDAIDLIDLVSLIHSQPLKTCPLCGHQFKNKQFYDSFYIDLQLTSFNFTQGHANRLLYNTTSANYIHLLSKFTGSSLRHHLQLNGCVYRQKPKVLSLDRAVPKDRRLVVVIDKRCLQVDGPDNMMAHAAYLNEQALIRQDLCCPKCFRVLRSNSILHMEYMEMLLAQSSNDFRTLTGLRISNRQRINNLRNYSDIEQKSEYAKKMQTYYWESYQCQLIRQPFIFKGCEHPFHTAICDYHDVQYQKNHEAATRFRCRYASCSNQYEFVDQMSRISLPIYQSLEADKSLRREVIESSKYWVEVGANGRVRPCQLISEEMKKQKEKYRTKILFKKEKQQEQRIVQSRIEQIKTAKRVLDSKTQLSQQEQQEQRQLAKELEDLEDKHQNLKKLTGFDQRGNQHRLEQVSSFYPTQVLKIAEKAPRAQQNPETKVDLKDIDTQGNLQLFKYPLPRSTSTSDILQRLRKLEQRKQPIQ